MATKKLFLVVFFTYFALASTASARETVSIKPTGVYPDDVDNVQAAVDKFGLEGVDGFIFLEAYAADGSAIPFNFGVDPDPFARGTVTVRSEHSGAITFAGQKKGLVRTTIMGGFKPISMDRADKLSVKNIQFVGAFQHAIFVSASTGAVITHNTILQTTGFDGFPLTRGIYFEGREFDAENITGRIVIKKNIIRDGEGFFSDAISFFFTNARKYVAHNEVAGYDLGVRDSVYQLPVTIYDNDFHVVQERDFLFASGMEIGCGLGDRAKATILGNHIFAQDAGANNFVTGISVYGADFAGSCPFQKSIIAGNRIEVIDAASAIDVAALGQVEGQVFDNLIAGNRVSGTAFDGVGMSGIDLFGTMPDLDIFENFVIFNDFRRLETLNSDVFLDASTRENLVVVRRGDVVVDLGTNNRVLP